MKKNQFLFLVLIIAFFFFSCKHENTPTPDPSSTTDIYITGTKKDSTGNQIPMYLKNGEVHNLPIGNYSSGVAQSIAISGNNIYVAGAVFEGMTHTAVYWKNDTLHTLTDGAHEAFATGIAVENNDIYILGQEYNASTIRVPKY